MECFVPGRVIVYPGSEGQGVPEESPFRDVEFSVLDVLKMNGIEGGFERLHDFPMPFVLRVPEGEEHDVAEKLSRMYNVKSAFPDFHVSPMVQPRFNEHAIQSAIAAVHGEHFAPICGSGVTVAVLDTGINGALLQHPGALHPVQFDVDDPEGSRQPPSDPFGHGTTVARIINDIAPGARLLSIQALFPQGSISGVIAGLYLAIGQGECDIVNLSLSLSCTAERCRTCRKRLGTNVKQLEYFFSDFRSRCERNSFGAVLVAAAGNNYPQISMPAAFPDVIAVGGYDVQKGRISDFSANYKRIPSERYILAPAGSDDVATSFASLPRAGGQKFSFGTSFATAFASGVIARFICGMKSGAPCGFHPSHAAPTTRSVLALLASNADKNVAGYRKATHGLGVLRYGHDPVTPKRRR